MKYCLVIIILCLFSAARISAQQLDEPFNYITVSGAGSYFLTDNLEDIGWYSTYGIRINAETPFYFGQIGVSLNFNPYSSRLDLPKMDIWGINLCWGEIISLSERVDIYAGITLGSCFLNFEGNQLTQYERLENELSLGANTKVIFTASKKLGFYMALGINKIFTNNKIRQADMGAGMEYKFSSGKWIKEFLN